MYNQVFSFCVALERTDETVIFSVKSDWHAREEDARIRDRITQAIPSWRMARVYHSDGTYLGRMDRSGGFYES